MKKPNQSLHTYILFRALFAGQPMAYVSLVSIIAFLSMMACKPSTEKKPTGKMLVVTTTGMIADAVKNVAGDKIEVIALMGPGVDPHLYKATHGDLEKLTHADIIFYNGLHLEGKMGEVLEKLGRTKKVIPVSANIPDSLLRSVPGFQGVHDPHIWFDVSLWKFAVQTIMEQLTQADSLHAQEYLHNGDAYLAQLDSLHNEVKNAVASLPENNRVLITAHDAFGYFGDAYSIEVRGLQGISTLSEFGLKDMNDLVDFILQRKVRSIFVETSVSDKSIRSVMEGCAGKGWKVQLGGSLYSDAMGPEGTVEGTYIGMVRKNVALIVDGLR